jgi:superfamily II DNA/RNA helicase
MRKEFKNIQMDEEIFKAVENLGYKELTEIQEKVIPVALAGKNILGASSTGSGKTLAFLMPMLEKTSWQEQKASTLILAPSRELAIQIKNEYDALGRYKKLSCVAVYGKQPMKEQLLAMKNRHQAISGTPGRVLDHLKRGTIKGEDITTLIIDEVDELLDRGFYEEMMDILSHLKGISQTMMFSATIREEVQALAEKIAPAYTLIRASKEEELNIKETHYKMEEKDKFKALLSIIYGQKPQGMIIFVNTKEACGRLQHELEKANVDALKIHGGMLQKDREIAMNRFKKKEVPYLVATDVAARGIDVSFLTVSLSYDFPVEKESYVHRKGRTGRHFREGEAIYFITERDERKVSEVEAYVGYGFGEPLEMDYRPFREEKDAFREFQKGLRKNRPKKKETHEDIMRLYVNGGKKKKIRAIDIVGTLHSIPGIETEDIGIITVAEMGSYIDILNGKGHKVLKELKERKIKGKTLKVERSRK